MHILLTNDDGLQARGLQILKEELMDYAGKSPSWPRRGSAVLLPIP